MKREPRSRAINEIDFDIQESMDTSPSALSSKLVNACGYPINEMITRIIPMFTEIHS